MRSLILLSLFFATVWSQCNTLPGVAPELETRHAVANTCASVFLSLSGGEVQEGTTCDLACKDGYIGSGTFKLTCTNKMWNGVNFLCAPVTTTTTSAPVDTTTTTVAPTTTTVAPTTTTVTLRLPGQSCDTTASNLGTNRCYLDGPNAATCVDGICVSTTTSQAATSTAPTTTEATTTTAPTTTAPTTTTGVTLRLPGQSCDTVGVNLGNNRCYVDGPNAGVCVDGFCVSTTTTTTTAAPASTTTEVQTTTSTTTAAPATTTVTLRLPGQSCDTVAGTPNLGSNRCYADGPNAGVCVNGICVSTTTTSTASTTAPTTTAATTNPTTTAATTITLRLPGQSCDSTTANLLRCYQDGPNKGTCIDGFCVATSTTAATTTAATTTPATTGTTQTQTTSSTTVTLRLPGQSCDATANSLGSLRCYVDGPNKATCVDGICVSTTTTGTATTTATNPTTSATNPTTNPTTTFTVRLPGQSCDTTASNLGSLRCYQDGPNKGTCVNGFCVSTTTTGTATTTTATNPTTTITLRLPGQSCDSTTANLGTARCYVDGPNKATCIDGICVSTTTTTTTSTASPSTTPSTTAAVTTILYSDLGGVCTGDKPVNPRFRCKIPLLCNASVCIAPPTTTTVAPTNPPTPVYGHPGDLCGVGRAACETGLVCVLDHCAFPAPPPPTISQVGGPCGGDTNSNCATGLNCVSTVASSTVQNLTLVSGICAAPTTETQAACLPGTQPALIDGVRKCVACKYGSYSEKGLICNHCPSGRFTPYPANFDVTTATTLSVGPVTCQVCPGPDAQTLVADPACTPNPVCTGCSSADGKVCQYVDSPYPTSFISVARCVPLVCPTCTNTQACVRGVCTEISTNLDAAAVQSIVNYRDAFAQSGTDPTQQTGVANNLDTPQNGQLVILNNDGTGSATPVTVPNANLDNTVVVGDKVNVVSTYINVRDGAPILLDGQASVFANTLDILPNVDGPATTKITATGAGGAKVNFTTINLDVNAVHFSGDVVATIGKINGDGASAFVQASGGATLDGGKLGQIDVPIKVTADGSNTASVNVRGNLETKAILGGGDLHVGSDAKLSTNDTVEANVKVDGVIVFNGKTVVKGSVQIGATGVLTIQDNPHLDAFTKCDGVIYFHVAQDCSKLQSARGALWTSTSNVHFSCQIIMVGNHDCQVGPLTLKTDASVSMFSLAHARRLLGATTTSDSGCPQGTGTATVTGTGATYQLCGPPNAASSQQVSYIVLFVTLFVALCLRF